MKKKLIILVFLVVFMILSSQVVVADGGSDGCCVSILTLCLDCVYNYVVVPVVDAVVDTVEVIVDVIDNLWEENCKNTGTASSGAGSCWVGGEKYAVLNWNNIDECKPRATCTLSVNPVHGDVLFSISCGNGRISEDNTCNQEWGVYSVADLSDGWNTICSDPDTSEGYLKVNKGVNSLSLKANMFRCRDAEAYLGVLCATYDLQGNDKYSSYQCAASYTPIEPETDCALPLYEDDEYIGDVKIQIYDDNTYDYGIKPLGQIEWSFNVNESYGFNSEIDFSSLGISCSVSSVSGGWKLGCDFADPGIVSVYEHSCIAGPGIDFDTNKDSCVEAFEYYAWIGNIDGGADDQGDQIYNKCCGDNPSGDIGELGHAVIAGEITDEHLLCIYNLDAEGGARWEWLKANTNPLKVKQINKQGASYDYVSNDERWYKCSENNIGMTDLSYSPLATESKRLYQYDFARFYCYKDGSHYRYVACTTPIGTPSQNMIQELEDKNKRDFGSVTTMVSEQSYGIGYIDVKDLDVTRDWTDYETLEFSVWLSDVRTPLHLRVLAPDTNRWNIFDGRVLDYAVDSIANDKWIHIAVPINDWVDVRILKFYDSATPDYPSDTIEIKNISLRPKQENIDNLAYCSDANLSEANSMWINDLDDFAAEEACKAIYDWTGTQCCGDDYFFESRFSPVKEYHSDSDTGCWASDGIDEHITFTEVKYELTRDYEYIMQNVNSSLSPTTTIQLGIITQHTQICDSDSCVYPLPEERPVTIKNLYSQNYDLFVIEDGDKVLIEDMHVQINAVDAFIQVENASQNILFYEDYFHGCSVPSSVTQAHTDLIQDVNSCDVKGDHFCSIKGAWSDDPDGVDHAYLRDAAKTTPGGLKYNKVTNPSFEE